MGDVQTVGRMPGFGKGLTLVVTCGRKIIREVFPRQVITTSFGLKSVTIKLLHNGHRSQ